MDWLRNWKKRLLLSVMTGMLAVTLLFGGTKMSRIALWRGGEPCIHSFALREDHRTALIMKIL